MKKFAQLPETNLKTSNIFQNQGWSQLNTQNFKENYTSSNSCGDLSRTSDHLGGRWTTFQVSKSCY